RCGARATAPDKTGKTVHRPAIADDEGAGSGETGLTASTDVETAGPEIRIRTGHSDGAFAVRFPANPGTGHIENRTAILYRQGAGACISDIDCGRLGPVGYPGPGRAGSADRQMPFAPGGQTDPRHIPPDGPAANPDNT